MRRLLLLLLPVLGTGCAQPEPADPVLVLRQALADHQASLAGIAPRPASAGGEGSVAPAVPPLPIRNIAAGPGEPPLMAGQLVGHPPATIAAWLGAPRLRREEEGAEVWHYQGPQCHLDLVFYRDDGPAGGLRVAFAAARAIGTARRGEAACLRDIAREAGPPVTPEAEPVAAPSPPSEPA